MTHGRPIVISTRTLLTALALVLAVMLAFVLREVLITVFVAAVLSAALDPWIGFLERRGCRGLPPSASSSSASWGSSS